MNNRHKQLSYEYWHDLFVGNDSSLPNFILLRHDTSKLYIWGNIHEP